MDNYHSLCHQEAHLYGALMLYTSNAIYRQLNAALRSHFGKTNNLQLGTSMAKTSGLCWFNRFNWFNLQRSKTEAESATTDV